LDVISLIASKKAFSHVHIGSYICHLVFTASTKGTTYVQDNPIIFMTSLLSINPVAMEKKTEMEKIMYNNRR
jgi:hypothetical protein